ncbi:hypothetical protein [Coxiella-like endosymbiont]|uniref:hypothetical protein n=1 Tax=Coxiella-like endosymbiont TaxID=1592897 RepID=UPI002868985E|nr:hypothetical protein [Coxiella-like endosymbiont]
MFQRISIKKSNLNQKLKINSLGEILTGCPLDEKISEMHVLKKQGYAIAALAVVMIDNPMCPATGHRVCNDCMKSCIYQKQEPVNIPQTETRVLMDVLELPWGLRSMIYLHVGILYGKNNTYLKLIMGKKC